MGNVISLNLLLEYLEEHYILFLSDSSINKSIIIDCSFINVNSNLITNNEYDLGESNNKWNNLYVNTINDGTTIKNFSIKNPTIINNDNNTFFTLKKILLLLLLVLILLNINMIIVIIILLKLLLIIKI